MLSFEVKKIKLSLFIFCLLIFSGYSISILATDNSSQDNIVLDSDLDGLSDEEELKHGTDPNNPDSDNDGYSDGAEVQSGYNPLKQAPGDKIISETETAEKEVLSAESVNSGVAGSTGNLTEEVSGQIANMIANSEGETGGVSIDKINTLIEESIQSKITFSQLPQVDESKIKILTQNYAEFSEEKQARKKKEDNEAYLSSIFYILSNNLPHSIASEDEIASFSDEIIAKIPMLSTGSGLDYFNDLAEKGEGMIEELYKLEVPQDMFEIHVEALQLATYAVSLKDRVNIDQSDPLASIVSLSEAENLLMLATDYLDRVESKLSELGLTGFLTEEENQIYE
ncbi:MAG: thrombospondin type 3 repeat-containing protein [Candidatus Moraniibacteriota bacterium]